MDAFKFIDKDNTWEISVKKEFIEVCSNPQNCTLDELYKLKFFSYLHNEYGPALRCLVPGKEHVKLYYINAHMYPPPPNTLDGKAKIQEIEENGKNVK